MEHMARTDANSDYGTEFPSFPGCVTAGSTLEEARVMATEALMLHTEGFVEESEEIWQPLRLETIDDGNADAATVLVELPVETSRPICVNIMIPEVLLRQIDQLTIDRSQFLASAAREALRRDMGAKRPK
jgi:predicted RNase H-like HicB family nuclease